MHTIRPASLKPGSTAAGPGSSRALSGGSDLPEISRAGESALIRGRALIFWDPKLPGTKFGRKLDAIDTDQITPAADCVSESLETLDERWKAGAFRYLMPDFRARVHRGETFVIAGDRFATAENAANIIRHSTEIGLLALVLTPVILTGGIDLSVGSLIALSAVVATRFIRDAAGAEQAGVTGLILSLEMLLNTGLAPIAAS